LVSSVTTKHVTICSTVGPDSQHYQSDKYHGRYYNTVKWFILLKATVFWDTAPSHPSVNRRFGGPIRIPPGHPSQAKAVLEYVRQNYLFSLETAIKTGYLEQTVKIKFSHYSKVKNLDARFTTGHV
jgi:hypothetical protein